MRVPLALVLALALAGCARVETPPAVHDAFAARVAMGASLDSPWASPENANGTLVLVRHAEGTWEILDARTFASRGFPPIPRANASPRWSPLDANSLYYVGASAFHRWDVARAEARVIGEYADYRAVVAGPESDLALTRDGHLRMALVAERVAGGTDALLLSVRERATFGRETVSSQAWRVPDDTRWTRFTPSGKVLVAGPRGVSVYAENGTREGALVDALVAGDVCAGERGREAFAFANASGTFLVDVATGSASRIAAGARDVTCRGDLAPGTVLLSEGGNATLVAFDGTERARIALPSGSAGIVPDREVSRVYAHARGDVWRVDVEPTRS